MYLLAPSAFLIPMILVLSLTETNIILATLNIPTRVAKPPRKMPKMFNASKKPFRNLDIIESWFREKSSSSIGLNLR